MKPTVVETARLVLRPWDEEDRGIFARLAADPRVIRYIGDGSAWDAARVDEVFGRQRRHWTEHGFGWRSATDKETSTRIGFVGLNHVGPEAVEIEGDDVEIGWWLDPSYWARGLATEGAVALRDEGFERVNLDRIIGRWRPENVASGRIMERLGMTFERDATGRHGEQVRIHALARSEWERAGLQERLVGEGRDNRWVDERGDEGQ